MLVAEKPEVVVATQDFQQLAKQEVEENQVLCTEKETISVKGQKMRHSHCPHYASLETCCGYPGQYHGGRFHHLQYHSAHLSFLHQEVDGEPRETPF